MSNEFEKEKNAGVPEETDIKNEELTEEIQDSAEEISEEVPKNQDEAPLETEKVDFPTEEENPDEDIKPKKKDWKKELLEWIESLAVAVVVALLIVNFVFTLVTVSGASMEPTLQDKNFLFVLRLGYEPDNGDIIVFKPVSEPKKYYIKRVIATEGQEVDIRSGKVYVDGEELNEPYIEDITQDRYNESYPKTVPENCVFVLGDNRDNSRDSRDAIGVGMVSEDSIVGKAWFRLFPFNKIGGLY